jgi:hypothetical protein
MDSRLPRIQPSSLTPEELARYARLYNTEGLPKDWVDALVNALEEQLDRDKK